MASKTQLPILEDEERRARTRVASFRARLFRNDGASPMQTQIRLQELERIWKGAAERLSRARRTP